MPLMTLVVGPVGTILPLASNLGSSAEFMGKNGVG
jgi:hypothetical protein